MTKQKYRVFIDDNFHFMDQTQRYASGTFDSYDEAVAKCKEIIDEFLESAIEPCMTAKQLYSSYTMFGEDPYIDGETDKHFSAWNYAEGMCEKMTGIK